MLKFVGDINLTDNSFDVGFGVGSLIKKGLDPFSKIKKNCSDVWIGNFEGVTSDVSEVTNYKKDCFRILPKYLSSCSDLIDYFGIANNHVMEHGQKAYQQMEEELNRRFKGAFASSKQKTIRFEHQAKMVSITGFSLRNDQTNFSPLYWNFPEWDEIKKEYYRIPDSDYKIAYIHWGVEFIDYPHVEQIRFAHWLIDLGFDLIIGMHPHILQGFEIYKGKYIFYSLGNFVFHMAWLPTKYSAIVNVDLRNQEVGYDYIMIDKEYCPSVIAFQDVPVHYRFEYLNEKIGHFDNLEQYISKARGGLKKYRSANYKDIILNLPKYNLKMFSNILIDFAKRRLLHAH